MLKTKKKCLIFMGSPRKNGYTARALNILMQKLEDKYEFFLVDSYEKNIKPCIACGLCETNFKCVYDDFKEIHKLLEEADLIIVATPVYNLTFPAPLKAIIDRMQIYFSAKFKLGIEEPIKKPKRGIMLAVSGSNKYDGVDIIREQLKMQFGLINTKLACEAICLDTDNCPSTDKIIFKNIEEV